MKPIASLKQKKTGEKKMSRQVMCFVVFVSLIFAGGCGDDDGGTNNVNPPGWEVQDVIVADDLKVIDDTVDVTVEPTALRIPISQAALVSDIQSGNLVVSSKGFGFLRRVVSVAENQDDVVFQTETASLAEALQQGRISGPIPLDFSSNPSQKDGFGLDYSGQVIYDSDGLTITLSQATVNFSPNLNLEIEYDWFSLEYFKAEVVGNLSGALAVQAVYEGSASFSDTVSLYDSAPITTTIWAGIVPIVVVTTLHLEAGFEAGLESSLSVEAGASFEAQVSAGAEFSNGAWDIIAEQDFQLTAIGPTLEISADADLRVFLRPKIVSKLYGVAGPSITVEPYGHLSMDLLPSPSWELSAGVLGTIDVEIEAFDHVLASYSDTLFDFEWSLASGGERCGDGICSGHESVHSCPQDCSYECIDNDGDGWGSGCGTGEDCNDNDPLCWMGACCPTDCVDNDGDGYGVGADCLGPDCDDSNPGIWTGCTGCIDNDGDGHNVYDAVQCPSGDDFCDGNSNNWTTTGCSSCIDADSDGYGLDCDKGVDCDDGDPGIWFGCTTGSVVLISAGGSQSCAVKDNGSVWCWGANTYGKLGDGTTTDRYIPVQVLVLSNVVSIGMGHHHTCALKSDGTIWCWGNNTSGQLGDLTIIDRHTPVQVANITGVVSISAGYYHTCAVKSDGTAWCWGINRYGQLGDGHQAHQTCTNNNYDCSLAPVQVSVLSSVASISLGDSYTCAVKSDGTVWCWGANIVGQLGDGQTHAECYVGLDCSLVPVQVSGLSNVINVSSGASHTCALKSDGTVWCWGYNGSGQLGDMTTTDRYTPIQVVGLPNFVSIDVSSQHTCALRSNNTAWCWGANIAGQLGDGTTTDRHTSNFQVSGLSDVTSIVGGYWHSCATRSDSTVWCWGANIAGQLGNGTTTNSCVPIQAQGL